MAMGMAIAMGDISYAGVEGDVESKDLCTSYT